MSNHKLFFPDSWSPCNLRDSKGNCNHSHNSSTPDTTKQGLKRQSIIMPSTKKKKLEPDESGNKNHATGVSLRTSKPSTSKNTDDDVASTSSSTSISEIGFDDEDDVKPCKDSLKLPYTYEEDEMILKFVLKGQNIFRVSSISLWKYLETKKVKPKRTYQSLKNRFLRNIKPKIFTIYRHLIDNPDTIEKILLKFPELKREAKDKKILSQLKESKLEKRKCPKLSSSPSSNEFEINAEENPFPCLNDYKSETLDQTILASTISHSVKGQNVERTFMVNGKQMRITISVDNSKVPIFPLSSLCERFGKLKKDKERVPCPTCGRFYRRPISNGSPDISEENDIPDSYSIDIEENPDLKNIHLTENKSPTRGSEAVGSSQSLLNCLEKSDKSQRHTEESNRLPEEVTENDDVIEVLQVHNKKQNSKKDKTVDNDSDIDLIYENTVEGFQKLIEADEETTPKRKCLNKDGDSMDLNANAEKNLDSFFLETQIEVPPITHHAVANNTRSRSQGTSRSSSALATNMMKMMANTTRSGRKLRK